jgi:hypothetical protein
VLNGREASIVELCQPLLDRLLDTVPIQAALGKLFGGLTMVNEAIR